MNRNIPFYIVIAALLIISSTVFMIEDVRTTFVANIQIDSVAHFIGFFFIAALLNGIIKLPLTNCIIVLIFYTALTECAQLNLGFRNAEIKDFVGDTLGVLTYTLLRWGYLVFNQRDVKQ